MRAAPDCRSDPFGCYRRILCVGFGRLAQRLPEGRLFE
jgi:hypothetical protein